MVVFFLVDFLEIMRQREEIFGLEDDLQLAFNVFDKEGNVRDPLKLNRYPQLYFSLRFYYVLRFFTLLNLAT